MIEAGAMKGVDGIFGLHVGPGRSARSAITAGAMSASADGWKIIVHGKQGHGAFPSTTVDPIVTGAEIVTALQTIVSRDLDLSVAPAVVRSARFTAVCARTSFQIPCG
jgi:amidohydrolase